MSTKRIRNADPALTDATEVVGEPVVMESLGEASDYTTEELRALLQAELITGQPANRSYDGWERVRRSLAFIAVGSGLCWIVVLVCIHFLG